MRKEKALTNLLRSLVDLLTEESARNPEFSVKLNNLLTELPEKRISAKKPAKSVAPENLPDIHAEWNARGEMEFQFWLRSQSIPVLRAIIRKEDLDAARRTVKWKEAEKLADFIVENLRARQSRGSAFIGRNTTE
jgi:hypothetical protein